MGVTLHFPLDPHYGRCLVSKFRNVHSHFFRVASAWHYPLHYHALVYTAGTDPGLPSGHTLQRVTVLRPAALMQRPGCEPESLVAAQRRPDAKKTKKKKFRNVHSSFGGRGSCWRGGGGGLLYPSLE